MLKNFRTFELALQLYQACEELQQDELFKLADQIGACLYRLTYPRL